MELYFKGIFNLKNKIKQIWEIAIVIHLPSLHSTPSTSTTFKGDPEGGCNGKLGNLVCLDELTGWNTYMYILLHVLLCNKYLYGILSHSYWMGSIIPPPGNPGAFDLR